VGSDPTCSEDGSTYDPAVSQEPPIFEPRSGETWRDPFPMYAALRDFDPVHHVERGDHWVLSRFEDVFRAARDPRRFSSAEGLTTTYGEREAVGLDEIAPMVMLDPPDHTDFRRLVSRGFTPRAVITMEDAIRAFVVERLDGINARGDEVDIVAELFKPLPSMVVAHFLGVPEADRPRFDRWTDAVVAANAAGDVLGAADAVGELFEYFTHLVELRREQPGDDTVSDLVAAAEADGTPTVLRILGFAFTMVAGGNDTTTGLLGGSAVLLTRHRDQRDLLRESPDLLPAAVEELLRLTSPVQGLARTTTEDADVQGTTIPAGRKVLLLYGAANRDSREFGPDAETLDVTRNPARILSFGSGAHHCLGAAAARLQGRVALEELLRRCPDFEVDEARGEYASGSYVRRHRSLPFRPTT
jgi:cytochrome P450